MQTDAEILHVDFNFWKPKMTFGNQEMFREHEMALPGTGRPRQVFRARQVDEREAKGSLEKPVMSAPWSESAW
jgi:hypothetical protein